MLKARGHQKRTRSRFRRIASGDVTGKFTLAGVTPGGGKTLGGVIAGDVLHTAGCIDRVLWLTPRRTLCAQAEKDWHSCIRRGGPLIRWAKDGAAPLIRGTGVFGVSATYQNVSANQDVFTEMVSGGRTLLILDEMQHLIDPAFSSDDKEEWIKSTLMLHDVAVHTFGLSGTLQRHDAKPLPFVEWVELENGLFAPKPNIVYTRAEAISERAIVPIDFHRLDGIVRWRGRDGKVRRDDMADAPQRIAVGASVDRDLGYHRDLLDLGVDTWLSKSRLSKRLIHRAMAPSRYTFGHIVVCDSQDSARATVDDLAARHGVARDMVALAISDGDPGNPHYSDALSEIDRFRSRRALVLVAVAMAHEGLNVPHAKVLTCMTNVRSIPWRDQMFARVNRFDRVAARDPFNLDYDAQRACAIVSSDADMTAYVDGFLDDQYSGIELGLPPEPTDGGPAGPSKPSTTIVLEAKSTGTGVTACVSPALLQDDSDPLELPEPVDRGPTPSEREARLLTEVVRMVSALSKALGVQRRRLEMQVKKFSKRPLSALGPEDLEKVVEFLRSKASTAVRAVRRR